MFAVTTLQNSVRIYGITMTGLTLLHDFPSSGSLSGNFPLKICFAEDNSLVVSGSDNGQVRMWRLSSGKQRALIHSKCQCSPSSTHSHSAKQH